MWRREYWHLFFILGLLCGTSIGHDAGDSFHAGLRAGLVMAALGGAAFAFCFPPVLDWMWHRLDRSR
ncbi:MAG TPA: hypothetical protein VGO93_16415 [Candidatus Xenobia bacterium]|jgi:hypothetical protein